MFQRFAYRIVMQGYWLEGGTPTFWFQPLYRWITGALHVVFGDSSVGELFWDGACLLTGACFAFHVTRRFAGFRWGIVAAVVTLAVFTIGPGWYLIGRGLSEISSAGFIYGAALLALRGRAGSRLAACGAGILATLGFYARLNNLPMMLAVAAFAWPVREPISAVLEARRTLASRRRATVLLGVLGAAALGLWLLTARTWYYTGVLSMLFGTQAGTLSVWQPTDQGESALQNVVGSVLMVLTMNDPPRFDVRSVPVVAGAIVARAGLAARQAVSALAVQRRRAVPGGSLGRAGRQRHGVSWAVFDSSGSGDGHPVRLRALARSGRQTPPLQGTGGSSLPLTSPSASTIGLQRLRNARREAPALKAFWALLGASPCSGPRAWPVRSMARLSISRPKP